MSTGGYSAWVWSPEHQRHYCYRYDNNGKIEYQWSGPTPAVATAQVPVTNATPRTPYSQQSTATTTSSSPTHPTRYTTTASTPRHAAKGKKPADEDEDGDDEDDEESEEEDERENSGDEEKLSQPAATTQAYKPTQPTTAQQQLWGRPANYPFGAAQPSAAAYNSTVASPSPYVSPPALYPAQRQSYGAPHQPVATPQTQDAASNPSRRHIKTSFAETVETKEDTLDPRYKRVSARHIPQFFCKGRVFKMLWTEPAGVTPGKTRGSTHFSLVRYGEHAYSEVRRFIVINNKGQYSQCIPIQTYRGQGARKRGIIVSDHAIIYTGHSDDDAPPLLDGEAITKQALRVTPSGTEVLEPASRVNFGKVYTVEHNVKVLDIGIVDRNHHFLLIHYFNSALAAV